MKEKLEKLKKFLRKKELSFTKERLEFLKGIVKQSGHFSVEALVYRFRKAGLKISRDTVYRNIPIFLEAGIIVQSFKRGRNSFYEVVNTGEHHDHIFCCECGTVKEFSDKIIEKKQKEISGKLGFQLKSHIHQLCGICSKCQKKKKTK